MVQHIGSSLIKLINYNKTETNMKTFPQLETICQELHEIPPDWEKIKNRFYQTHDRKKRKKVFYLNQLVQRFSEIHLDISLEMVAEKEPGCNISFGFEENVEGKKYQLIRKPSGRVFAIWEEGEKEYEYDQLILVDGQPVIFEMKVRKWNTGKTRKRMLGGVQTIEKGSCVKNQLRADFYNPKLNPARQYFDMEVGYVIVLPNNQYNKVLQSMNDPIVNQFFRKKGILVPLYTNRQSFRKEVREKAEEYHLIISD